MLSTVLERSVPYTSEQLFDVAADIESYPQFLRWWQQARVRERDGERWVVDNTVALGPMRLQFESEALRQRPQRLEVSSRQAPFRHLQLSWQFEPQPAGCRVQLSVELELRSSMMQLMLERAVTGFLGEILFAFEARARELYGNR